MLHIVQLPTWRTLCSIGHGHLAASAASVMHSAGYYVSSIRGTFAPYSMVVASLVPSRSMCHISQVYLLLQVSYLVIAVRPFRVGIAV